MKDQKMRGSSVSSSIILGLLLCSILIAAQITLSPLFSISSSSSSSSRADLSPGSSLSHHSATPTNQPSPEMSHGKIKNEVKQDPHSWQPSQSSIATQITCDRTAVRYDECNISGPTVVDPTTATFFVMGPKNITKPNIVEKIKPYPRKFDGLIMTQIKDVTLISGPQSPPCKVHHNVPALVFSVGGYTGNFFHDFNDGFIPLFITVNTILRDQDFVIVISEGPDWWPTKYAELLKVFSKHQIATLANETTTHCFPSAYVGLISHGFMTINQTLLPNSGTFLHFRDTLRKAYDDDDHNQTFKKPNSKPRLVLASRHGTTGRMIVNEREAIQVMEEVGFDVVVFEPKSNTSLRESYALISSSHAMIGVHGAALTHSLFLRPRSVLMQIVPIGVEWAADAFFGRVGRGLNLQYMEYRIKVEESSLVEEYGKESLMLRNPFALQKKGWPPELMNTYLKKQNVRLDLVRFRGVLEEAYKKAKKFMDKESGHSLVPQSKAMQH